MFRNETEKLGQCSLQIKGNNFSFFIILLYLTYLDESRWVFTNRLRHVIFQNYEEKVNKFAKSQGLFDQIKNMFSIFRTFRHVVRAVIT